MAEPPVVSPIFPLVRLVAALGGAFVLSTIYAVLLSTTEGKRWADNQTWATVVAGVALTLACLAIFQPVAAGWATLFFVATGTPIIFRSLWLQLHDTIATYDRIIDRE